MTITPFEITLRHELDGEFLRMANSWFFPWHRINQNGECVDVEDFYGGRITVGGIVFQGQIQRIYWQSVRKYLADKSHSTFARWRLETAGYLPGQRRSSLGGVTLALKVYAARLVAHAVNTDRALRGQGFPDRIEAYDASGVLDTFNAECCRLKDTEENLIPPDTPTVSSPAKSFGTQIEEFFTRWRSTLAVVSIIIALLGLGIKLLGG